MAEAHGTFQPWWENGGMAARIDTLDIFLKDNTINLSINVPHMGQFKADPIKVQMYDGNPEYKTLEGYMRRADKGARVGIIVYEEVGCVLWFYDARPGYLQKFPDGDVDPQAGGFGWAINVQYPYLSEPGTSPFPVLGQTMDQKIAQDQEGIRRMVDAFGGPENVTFIDGGAGDVVGINADLDPQSST